MELKRIQAAKLASGDVVSTRIMGDALQIKSISLKFCLWSFCYANFKTALFASCDGLNAALHPSKLTARLVKQSIPL